MVPKVVKKLENLIARFCDHIRCMHMCGWCYNYIQLVMTTNFNLLEGILQNSTVYDAKFTFYRRRKLFHPDINKAVSIY